MICTGVTSVPVGMEGMETLILKDSHLPDLSQLLEWRTLKFLEIGDSVFDCNQLELLKGIQISTPCVIPSDVETTTATKTTTTTTTRTTTTTILLVSTPEENGEVKGNNYLPTCMDFCYCSHNRKSVICRRIFDLPPPMDDIHTLIVQDSFLNDITSIKEWKSLKVLILEHSVVDCAQLEFIPYVDVTSSCPAKTTPQTLPDKSPFTPEHPEIPPLPTLGDQTEVSPLPTPEELPSTPEEVLPTQHIPEYPEIIPEVPPKKLTTEVPHEIPSRPQASTLGDIYRDLTGGPFPNNSGSFSTVDKDSSEVTTKQTVQTSVQFDLNSTQINETFSSSNNVEEFPLFLVIITPICMLFMILVIVFIIKMIYVKLYKTGNFTISGEGVPPSAFSMEMTQQNGGNSENPSNELEWDSSFDNFYENDENDSNSDYAEPFAWGNIQSVVNESHSSDK